MKVVFNPDPRAIKLATYLQAQPQTAGMSYMLLFRMATDLIDDVTKAGLTVTITEPKGDQQ